MKLDKDARRAAVCVAVISLGFTMYELGGVVEKLSPSDGNPLGMIVFTALFGLLSVVMWCLALFSEEDDG